jgi:hypothetical protein
MIAIVRDCTKKITLLKVTDTYIGVPINIALLKFALLEVNND